MERTLDLALPSNLWAVRKAARMTRDLLNDRIEASVIDTFELALVEACTNAVRHGNVQDGFRVQVKFSTDAINATVESHGVPFDFWAAAVPDFDADDPLSLPTGGMGLGLIKKLTDTVGYETLDDSTNRITLGLSLESTDHRSGVDFEDLETSDDGSLSQDEQPPHEVELQVLREITHAFEQGLPQSEILASVLESVQRILPFERAQIWIQDATEREYRCLLRTGDEETPHNSEVVPASDPADQALLECGPQVLHEGLSMVQESHEFFTALAATDHFPTLLLPLVQTPRVLGVVLLRLPPSARDPIVSSTPLLEAIARQMALYLQLHVLMKNLRENEGLRKEMDIARQIQSSLLPQSVPGSDAFDLFAGCITAAEVGGDYYDYFSVGEGKTGVLVADVSGHSVASGLVAMSFRSSFRHFLAEQGVGIPQIFAKVNNSLQEELSRTGHFLSAVYGVFDERNHRFRYVNAGHHPALVYNPQTQEFRQLSEVGLLLGVLPDWRYVAAETDLVPGDVLVLYTDGIVEAENQHGDLFGLERFQDAIRRHADKSSKLMYHQLLREVYIFQDEQFNRDDITLLILKVK